MSRPDPVQIVAAQFKRFMPQEAGAAEMLAQVVVRELQRNGWLCEWEPIRIHGVIANYDQMGDSGGRG